MTTRLVGGLAVMTLALGILIGAAGVIVIREAADPRTDPVAGMADQMGGMQSMMAMMGGSMMGGSGMGGPGIAPGPLHELHHPAVSPEPTR
jgi:hypothetical protein